MVSKKESRQVYTTRINRVILFITEHLSENLSLEVLAKEAFFSPYHFHRIFTYVVGETPNAYVNRVRLEKAANMLFRNTTRTVTDIAFTCGFSSSAAFSRSFKQHFGCSATEWKKQHTHEQQGIHDFKSKVWNGENLSENSGLEELRKGEIIDIPVKRMPGFHVAYVASLGGYHIEDIEAAWNRLCKWAATRDLLTDDATMIGMSYDDSAITPLHKCRYYACMTVPDTVLPDDVVGIMNISAARCAVYHFEGPAEEIQVIFKLLYAEWLPDSGYQPADMPSYELYYSPLEPHPQGFYRLDICLPVEPL